MSFGPVWAYTLTGAVEGVDVGVVDVDDDVLAARLWRLDCFAPSPTVQADRRRPHASSAGAAALILGARPD